MSYDHFHERIFHIVLKKEARWNIRETSVCDKRTIALGKIHLTVGMNRSDESRDKLSMCFKEPPVCFPYIQVLKYSHVQVVAYPRGNHSSLYHDFRFTRTIWAYFFFKRNTDTRSFSDILIEYARQTKRYFTFAFISKLRWVRCLTVAQHNFTRISSSRIFRRARLKIR